MNEGIADALRLGVPKEYVAKTLRKFIFEGSGEEVKEFAHKQAIDFRDETLQLKNTHESACACISLD